MDAVRANVREGNSQISLATEDMFIWGQVHTGRPFYFPNREALVDLYRDVVGTPGVEHHLLSHCTMAPAVVDPKLIEQLSGVLLDKSPVKLPSVSTHPEGRILSPLIGMETASVRMAKQIMPGKARAVPDRRMAERADPGADHSQPQQLVSGDDPDGRQSGRDRRGLQGHPRSALRSGAARPVRVLRALDLHARCTTPGWRTKQGVQESRRTDAACSGRS